MEDNIKRIIDIESRPLNQNLAFLGVRASFSENLQLIVFLGIAYHLCGDKSIGYLLGGYSVLPIFFLALCPNGDSPDSDRVPYLTPNDPKLFL